MPVMVQSAFHTCYDTAGCGKRTAGDVQPRITGGCAGAHHGTTSWYLGRWLDQPLGVGDPGEAPSSATSLTIAVVVGAKVVGFSVGWQP